MTGRTLTYIFFFAALVCGGSSVALAQGSPLDLIGFGRPLESAGAHIEALGDAGVTLTDRRVVSGPNPASWSWLTLARVEANMAFGYVQSSQPDYGDARNQSIRFSGFAFGAQLWSEHQLGFSLGFFPLTDASAIIQQGDSISSSTYRSEGGVSEGYLGVGATVVPGVALGGRLDVLFGNVRHLSEIKFTDPEITSSDFERDYALSGVRGAFGVILVGDSIANPLSGITVGLTYSMPSNLSSALRTVITPISSQLDTTIESPGFGYYPGSLQAGIAARIGGRYSVKGDVLLQDFSNAYLYAPQTSTGDPALSASARYAIGIERAPNIATEFGSSGFWDKLGLRIGASYYQMPFRPAGSGGVNALAVSGGLGIPISGESILDLSFTAGERNPVNAGTTPKDFFIKFGATISLAEKWFVPSRPPE